MDVELVLAVRCALDHPDEVARRLEATPPADAAALLQAFPAEVAAGVLEIMLPPPAAAALVTMGADAQSAVLGLMSDRRCAVVLRMVPRSTRSELLERLGERRAAVVERLLRAPRGSAGSMAEPVERVLRPDMTAGEASSCLDPRCPYGYVVDDEGRLVGVVHARTLRGSAPDRAVGGLMTTDLVRLPSATPLPAAAGHPSWDELDALPVIDGDGALVGIIRHKQLRGAIAAAAPSADRRPALTAFIELGELYWGGLTALVSASTGAGPMMQAPEDDDA